MVEPFILLDLTLEVLLGEEILVVLHSSLQLPQLLADVGCGELHLKISKWSRNPKLCEIAGGWIVVVWMQVGGR